MSDKEQHAMAGRHGWPGILMHRWPTVFGIALALLTAFGGGVDREFTAFLSVLIIFMAFIYVGTAVLGRQSSAWLLFWVGLVVITALRLLGLNGVAVSILLLVALAFLILGGVRRRWQRESALPLETLGMVAFSIAALAVLNLSVTWAGYLAGTALIGHAFWDAVHLRRNQVVARSYAEFCAVLDVVLGVAILVML